jgi:hypothetical protein
MELSEIGAWFPILVALALVFLLSVDRWKSFRTAGLTRRATSSAEAGRGGTQTTPAAPPPEPGHLQALFPGILT